MDSLSTQGSLELEVVDFGPIIEGKIDLRPLTVFIGPSNTGKSYLAILIYALHRYFTGGAWLGRRRYPQGYRMFRDYKEKHLSREAIDTFIEMVGQMFADKGKLRAEGSIILPGPVADEIRSGFDLQGAYLGNEIGRCFGIDKAAALIRKGDGNSARIVFRRYLSKDSAPSEHELDIGAQETKLRTTIPEETLIRIDANDKFEFEGYPYVERALSNLDKRDEERHFFFWRLIESLANLASPHLFGSLNLPAFYLPADRTGVMHAHSVVVSALIGSAAMTGLRPAPRTPMLSGVLADFLEQLIEFGQMPNQRRRSRRDLGTRIEKAILGGSVRIDRSEAIGYPHFTYRPDGWESSLSLMNASSMVSELAPVVLYLRHIVEPANVLIVEEPESHLHPDMQVKFTRQLATLVRSGVRVIITTHSEWVLEELANTVRRSQLSEAERKGMADGNVALRSDQVGAWLFQPKRHSRGSVVTEIRLDDSGLYPSGFDEVAAALHNDWAEISSRIGETE